MNARWKCRLGVIGATAAMATPLSAGIAQAAEQWAHVDAAGSLINGSTVKTVTRDGVGAYTVKFKAAVGTCAYLASLSQPTAGMVTTSKVAGNGKSVAVRTVDAHSQPADASFALQVQCDSTVPFAVVSAAGKLVRGSTGAAATMTATGEYRVTFATPVSSCATSATIGGTAAKPTAPQLITVTASSGLPYSVLVRVQSADGVKHKSAFHLQVTCGTQDRWAVIVPSSPSALFRTGYAGVSFGIYAADGNYFLGFPQDPQNMAACSAVGTVSGWGTTADFPHQAFVWAYGADATNIVGRTPDVNGNPLSRGISLHIVC